MKIFNKYKAVIAIILPIIIVVIFRSVGFDHFKTNAKKWAEPSVDLSNIISLNQIESLSGAKLILNLNKENMVINYPGTEVINISIDSLLNKANLNIIRKHDGPVLIVNGEIGVSARIWMILSQMGFANIYIISTETDNEVLKYKFRPDTLVKPEL